MRLSNLTARPAGPHATLARLSKQPFPTSDQVLLCAFRDDLAGEGAVQELRDSLIAARVTRHLIRISPVLRKSSKGRYQLKPLSADRRPAAVPRGDTKRTHPFPTVASREVVTVPLMLRDQAEVRERYQEAVVQGRSLGWTVNHARNRHQFEYLAEYEVARYDGVASAMKWVLGAAPISPCTDQLILGPTPAQVEAEAQAAEVELQALIEPFDLAQTTRPAVVHGIANSLRWAIQR